MFGCSLSGSSWLLQCWSLSQSNRGRTPFEAHHGVLQAAGYCVAACGVEDSISRRHGGVLRETVTNQGRHKVPLNRLGVQEEGVPFEVSGIALQGEPAYRNQQTHGNRILPGARGLKRGVEGAPRHDVSFRLISEILDQGA